MSGVGVGVIAITLPSLVALAVLTKRFRRVSCAVAHDAGVLARWLRGRDAQGLRLLAEHAGEGDATGALLHALVAQRPRDHIVACANEVLHDVAGELGWGATMGAPLVRACILATLLAAASTLVATGGVSWGLVDVIVLGAGILATAASAVREATLFETSRRAGLDALVDAALSARVRGESMVTARANV